MREQWRRWFSSREPAHWMKAMFFASLPSDGRSNLAAGRAVRIGERSNSTLVITLAKRP